MKNIAIFGAGGFGREVAMLINHINEKKEEWNLIGFYDDRLAKGSDVHGYEGAKVLGGVDALNSYGEPLYVVFAIADPRTKKKIITKIDNTSLIYPTLIHPSVWMGRNDVIVGEGSIITAGVIITVNIRIGRHVILNLSNTVGHDTIIADYCSFMPSVSISGEVKIEECVYVGTGAKIINQVAIGASTIVGAGAVVSKTLPANCTAVGIPAKPIKFHE